MALLTLQSRRESKPLRGLSTRKKSLHFFPIVSLAVSSHGPFVHERRKPMTMTTHDLGQKRITTPFHCTIDFPLTLSMTQYISWSPLGERSVVTGIAQSY